MVPQGSTPFVPKPSYGVLKVDPNPMVLTSQLIESETSDCEPFAKIKPVPDNLKLPRNALGGPKTSFAEMCR